MASLITPPNNGQRGGREGAGRNGQGPRGSEAPRRGAPDSPASRDFSVAMVYGGGGALREFGMGRKTLKIKTGIYKPGGFGG